MNNFNFIAPVYDGMVRLTFGKTLLESQKQYLSTIQSSDTVLILGGGTGQLLEILPKCASVHFVEFSKNMLKRARKRSATITVDFIFADFLNHNFTTTYDVILCPFFLDLFDKVTLQKVIQKMKTILAPNGRLVVTDFQKTPKNGLFLKSMYTGFRVVTSVQAHKLPNIEAELETCGLVGQEKSLFFREMVFSRVYGFGGVIL